MNSYNSLQSSSTSSLEYNRNQQVYDILGSKYISFIEKNKFIPEKLRIIKDLSILCQNKIKDQNQENMRKFVARQQKLRKEISHIALGRWDEFRANKKVVVERWYAQIRIKHICEDNIKIMFVVKMLKKAELVMVAGRKRRQN